MTFAEIVAYVNTRVAGWAAYYGRFYKSVLYAAFRGLNGTSCGGRCGSTRV